MEAGGGAVGLGRQRARAAERQRFTYGTRVARGIRLCDGRGIRTWGDQRPTRSSRRSAGWCTRRANRAWTGWPVNRTAERRWIDLLFDTCLPITVDEVISWRTPSLWSRRRRPKKLMLATPVDMVKLWPGLWQQGEAAYRTLASGVRHCRVLSDHLSTQKDQMKQRVALFDRSVVWPRRWLEGRLGALS
jgi:hypothetical protein